MSWGEWQAHDDHIGTWTEDGTWTVISSATYGSWSTDIDNDLTGTWFSHDYNQEGTWSSEAAGSDIKTATITV